ncbi:MAG: T9SS type A sorting domain-containing protein [Armatimonadetes bacterium]|nr:T9SS type A sorting domain-containing protein [Armatimonadota bacterium]
MGYAGFTISVTDNVTDAISTLDFNITVKPFTVYLDDDWIGFSYGNAVEDTLVFGQNAFLVLNNAVEGLAPTGTIHVRAGTYDNGITIDKSLTMTTAEIAIISLSTDLIYGLTISADDVNVEGFTFQNLANAIILEGMNILITACKFDNCVNGVFNTGTSDVNATRNWWDDPRGPIHPSNPHYGSTSGSVVSDNVNFIPWNATTTVTPEREFVTVFEPDADVTIIAVSDIIQAGIYAALDGNLVEVTNGTYTEDLTVDAGIILRSENGKAVTFIQQVDGIGVNVGENADNFIFGSSVQGFTILSGNSTTQSVRIVDDPSNVSIIDNSFDIRGYALEGISVDFSGATDLTISDNTLLTDSGDSGIWIANSTNVTISGNTFICSGYPISGWAMHIIGCTDPIISDNTITNFHIGISLSCGAGFIGGVINSNSISDCTYSIYISEWSAGSFGTMANVELSENTISSDQVAIYISDGSYIDASTFTIEYNNFVGGNSDFGSRQHGKGRNIASLQKHIEHFYGFIVASMDLTDYGIYNAHSTEIVTAEDNWWNDMNGPYHDPNNLDTNGLNVSDNVDFRAWAIGNPAVDNLDHVLALTITSPGSVDNISTTAPIPFEVDFEEEVHNFDENTEISIIGDYLNDPVAITDEGSGLFTFDLTPEMDNAEMTVSVLAEAAEDVAGNYNEAVDLTITYDAVISRYIITVTPTSPYLLHTFAISVEAVDTFGYRDTDYNRLVMLTNNHPGFVNLINVINLISGYAEAENAGLSTQLTDDLSITAREYYTLNYESTLENIIIQLPAIYPPTGHDGIGDPVVYDVPDDQGGWITLEYGLSRNDPFHAEPLLPYINNYLVERNNEPDGSGEWEFFATIGCYNPNAAGNVTALLAVPEDNTPYPYRLSSVYIPGSDVINLDVICESRTSGKPEIIYLNEQPIDEIYYTSRYAMCGSAAGADNIPAFADIKIYLEGPYDTDNMMTASHVLPLISPYSGEGIDVLPDIPGRQLIDWVELQLRTTETGETEQQADAFLLDDGSIVNTIGYKNFPFAFTTSNEYFLVIHHRNHLDVMTANTYLLGDSEEATTEIDLSHYQSVFGHDLKQVDDEVYALYSGDANDDGIVDLEDINELNIKTEDDFGYLAFDFDMNGYLSNEDLDNYFWPNLNVMSHVPGEDDFRGDNSEEITSGELETNLPQCVPLHSYPNPFNPSTTIKFSVAEESRVELTIFNLKGQKIITLVAETLPQGIYSFEWNGEDECGQSVVSGIYLYRLEAGKYSSVKKMILLK